MKRDILKRVAGVIIAGIVVASGAILVSANTGNFNLSAIENRVEVSKNKIDKIVTEKGLQAVQVIKAIDVLNGSNVRLEETYKEILKGQLGNIIKSMQELRSMSGGIDDMLSNYKKYIGDKSSVTASEIINCTKKIDIDAENKEYIMPVDCLYVSSLFGDTRPEKIGHTGIDFAAKKESEIKVVDDGIAIFAGDCGTYGTAVFVLHGNNKITVYAHMIENSNTVEIGDFVYQGDVIGKVGKTGRATGYHLHFEVIENGERINPIDCLNYKFEGMN